VGQEDVQDDDAPQLPDLNMVYLDINIGEGRKARITLHRGQNVMELASNFAQMHSLDPDMQLKLQESLAHQAALSFGEEGPGVERVEEKISSGSGIQHNSAKKEGARSARRRV
jgi:hypothetical protein